MHEDESLARARFLLDAHAAGQPFAAFTGEYRLRDLDEAYAVQAHFVAGLLAVQRTRIFGYKVGLTSQRMQTMCGIASPIAGVILAHAVHRSGVELARGRFGRLGVEFEIAVRLGQDLPAAGAPYDFATVAAAVADIAPAVEVVDDRAADYAGLDMLSLVADNSWNAGLVLGEFHPLWPDLAAVRGVVYRDGEELDRGHGADVLGHPFASLTWLANHLARTGGGLRAGDVVATGTLVPTRFPAAAESYRFVLDGVGEVAVRVCE